MSLRTEWKKPEWKEKRINEVLAIGIRKPAVVSTLPDAIITNAVMMSLESALNTLSQAVSSPAFTEFASLLVSQFARGIVPASASAGLWLLSLHMRRWIENNYPDEMIVVSFRLRQEDGTLKPDAVEKVVRWIKKNPQQIDAYLVTICLPYVIKKDKSIMLEFIKRSGDGLERAPWPIMKDRVVRVIAFATVTAWNPWYDPVMRIRDVPLAELDSMTSFPEECPIGLHETVKDDLEQEGLINSYETRDELRVLQKYMREAQGQLPDVKELLKDRTIVREAVSLAGHILVRMRPEFRNDVEMRLLACKTDPHAALLVLNDLVSDTGNQKDWRLMTAEKILRIFSRDTGHFKMQQQLSKTKCIREMDQEEVNILDAYSVAVSEIMKIYSLVDSPDLTLHESIVRRRIMSAAERVQEVLLSPDGRIFKELMNPHYSNKQQRIKAILNDPSVLPPYYVGWMH
jgi:hypothetical protein